MTTPVSFKLAKLLKEKGISIYSEHRYTDFNGIERLEKDASEIFPYAPTIAEVVMWLYEKHEVWISVICDCGNDNLFYSKIFSTEIGIERCIWTIRDKNSPTEAYETAIKYTLNNLI